jgi:hypothetical protein
MAKFLTELNLELVNDTSNSGRGEWKVTSPLIYISDIAYSTFVVPSGFMTDMASVPRIPGVFILVGDTGHEAAALHDFLYSSHTVPRNIADAVLKEAALVTGLPSWRCWMLYAGVRVFGGSHW